MKRNKVLVGAAVVLVAAVAVPLFAASSRASAPFSPVSAAANIAALKSPPVFATPAAVSRIGSDLVPAAGETHALGATGYAWKHGGAVCVLMNGSSGGCFATFKRPFIAFMTAQSDDGHAYVGAFHISGVLVDGVRSLSFANGPVGPYAPPLKH